MAKIEVVLPQMGEGIIEATITRWLFDLNSQVQEDDPLVEIATDKVDSEVPAPASGTLLMQFFAEGEIPKVGDVIAIIEDGNEEVNDTASNDTENSTIGSLPNSGSTNISNALKKPSRVKRSPRIETNESEFIPPFIRFFANARDVTVRELKQIQGSGKNGQLTKQDIFDYIKDGRPFRNDDFIPPDTVIVPKIKKILSDEDTYQPKAGEEIVELGKTRSMIAQHMVDSVRTSPHVTSFVEADVTALVKWRDSIKEQFIKEHGVNFTYTTVLVEIIVKALKEFPGINVSLLPENKLLKKSYYNIGIATALPDGNLIVPVVKDADKFNTTKLAIDIADLTDRARNGKLKPGDASGGTFTITNLGLTGSISGTPIINQPESAILAVGAFKKKPGVVDTNGVLSIGIRDILTLSLSYDHRIIDGALGGTFLSRVAQMLEEYTPDFS